ncbi:T9SS type A sorting domain-containing protein [Empedobacter falsenii]
MEHITKKNWIHKFDNKGNLTKTIPLNDYYWFQSLPVFPDNAAPIINDLETTYQINTATTIDLKDKVSDLDNLSAAIVKDLEIIENDNVAEISINEKDELVINPLKNGTAKIKLSFNSNGKVVSQNITISSAVLGTSDLNKSSINVYPNPVNNVLFIETNEASKAEIFAITGTKMTEKTLQKGKNQLDVSSLPKGVYIIKVNNSTFKVIKK